VRIGQRAKKVEKIVHAREAMKHRLADYRSFCEQGAQPEEDAS
jgi:hypothetical protein